MPGRSVISIFSLGWKTQPTLCGEPSTVTAARNGISNLTNRALFSERQKVKSTCGPISKVPYTGSVVVRIDKRKNNEVILVGPNFNKLSKLELVPNYTVKRVDYKSIPKSK